MLCLAIGNISAASQLCQPKLTWGAYACISKVEIGNLTSESSTSPAGWNGKIGGNTYDESVLYTDYTGDASRTIQLEAGKEYDLKITVCNFSSGAGDEYYVTAFADWNGDNQLTQAETLFQNSISVGKPGPTSFKVVTGKVAVPASVDATKKITMRVYLHYKTPDVPYTEPCCDQDGGVLQDYNVKIGTSAIHEVAADNAIVYPNPTDGTVFVKLGNASEYMLFSVDGKLIAKGRVANGCINVAGNQPGMYILQLLAGDKRINTNLIIK